MTSRYRVSDNPPNLLIWEKAKDIDTLARDIGRAAMHRLVQRLAAAEAIDRAERGRRQHARCPVAAGAGSRVG